MIDQSWDLIGLDALSREHAVEEAERRGLTLAEYLTEIMAQATAAEIRFAEEPAAAPPSPPSRADNLEFRHRLDALDRRLGVSVGGMEAALHAVDASVDELGDRLLGAEKSIAANAEDTARALEDVAANLGAMRVRLAEAEDAQTALRAATDRGADALARKIDAVAATTQATAGAITVLEQAHDQLRHALESDFGALAADTAERMAIGLDAARAAAEAAADHADRVAARLENELAQTRAALDQGLEDSAANARALVQAAFEDAADRILALAQGLSDVDRRQARRADQLQASIADALTANKAAIQQATASLRQADSELGAQIAKTTKESQTALGALRDGLSGELSEVRRQQASTLNRIERLAADVADATNALGHRQDTLESAFATLRTDVNDAIKAKAESWDERFEAAAAQFGARQHMLNANLERVELSTIAALETLSNTMRERDADLESRIAASMTETNALVARVETRLEAEVARAEHDRAETLSHVAELKGSGEELRCRLASLESHVADLVEMTSHRERALAAHLATLSTADQVTRIDARLGKVEVAVKNIANLEALRKRVDELATQVAAAGDNQGLSQRLEDLRARLAPLEAQTAEAASGMQGVARMLGRLTSQNTDAAAQSEKRFAKLEKALAEVHLASVRDRNGDEAHALDARLQAFEDRHDTALEALRAEIRQFISENDRRLAAIERGELPGGEDLAAAFDTLRRRMDERVADVEQRSARALEQVADTVSLIERRLLATAGPRA
jgi:hypothetical protein